MQKTILFNKRNCLTYEAIEKYNRNELSDTELKLLLKHTENCLLCSDAISGLDSNNNYKENISILKENILSKTKIYTDTNYKNRKTKYRYLIISAAATVAIILGLQIFTPKNTNDNFTENTEWLQLENIKQSKTIPLPKNVSEYKKFNSSKIISTNTLGLKKLSKHTFSNNETDFSEQVYNFTDEMPEFPGGIIELDKQITNGIRIAEKQNKVNACGTVLVKFIITESGEIADTKVLNSHNRKLNNIAIDLINKLPTWKPGRQSGRLVKVAYTLPIKFENC